MVTTEQRENLEKIIVNRWIRPVFQPIVSLRDGSVLDFEALSSVRTCFIKKRIVCGDSFRLATGMESLSHFHWCL